MDLLVECKEFRGKKFKISVSGLGNCIGIDLIRKGICLVKDKRFRYGLHCTVLSVCVFCVKDLFYFLGIQDCTK